MAFKIGEMFWKVKADTSDFDKNVKGSENTAESFGKKTSGIGSLFKIAFVAAIVAGVAKVSKALVLAASEAEEVQNKFDVTFSSISDKAEETAKDIAESYGVSRTSARELLAGTGDLLSGFGFTQKSALELSTTVNQLAGDLASFQNVDIVQASNAITSGLLGEREALKSLGIAITEADIKQLAEDKGITGSLDRQTKAALTLEIALKQSGNAIGDFARSEASFANQSRIASANVQNLKESFGAGLLPIANAGITIFNQLADELQTVADSFGMFIQSEEGASKIAGVIGAIAGAISTLKEIYGDIFPEMGEALEDLITPLQDFLAGGEKGINIYKVLSTVFKVLGGYIQIVTGLWQIGATYVGNLIVFWIKYVDIFIKGAKLLIAYGKASVNPFNKEAQANLAKSAKEFGVSFLDAGKQVVNTFVETGKKIGTEVKDFVKDTTEAAEKYEDAFTTANKNIFTATQDSLLKVAKSAKELAAIEEEEQKKRLKNEADEKKKAQEQWLKDYGAYQARILELTGTEAEKLEAQRQEDLELARKAGADIYDIEKYYSEERQKLADEEAEKKEEAIKDQLQMYEGFAGGVGDIMGGLIDFIKNGDEELTQSKKDQILIAYRLQQSAAIAQIGISTAIAAQEAYKAMAGIPYIGPALGVAAAAAAIASGAVQIGTVIATPPPFRSGGIVGGSPSNVDTQLIQAQPGEEVIPMEDARHRFNGGGQSMQVIVNLDGRVIAESTINDYANTGRVVIDARAIS